VAREGLRKLSKRLVDNVLHATASAPHSEPSASLGNVIGWTSVQIEIVASIRVDGSLCGALAMAWSTLYPFAL